MAILPGAPHRRRRPPNPARQVQVLGLFENPYGDPRCSPPLVGSDEHRAPARQAECA